MLLKESVDTEINASIWLCWMMMKKTSSLIEDKRKDKAQRAHTRRNPKRHTPLVSLLLWRKMMASRLATVVAQSVSQAVSLKFEFWRFFKILYPATCLCLMLYYALYGLVLFCKGDFRLVRCL